MVNMKQGKKSGSKKLTSRHKTMLVLLFPMITVAIIATIITLSSRTAEWNGVSKDNLIENIRKHVDLPVGNPEQVFRVQDATVIKKEGEFYKDAQDGDWVVIYNSIAVIYDGRKDIIRNVVSKQSSATSSFQNK